MRQPKGGGDRYGQLSLEGDVRGRGEEAYSVPGVEADFVCVFEEGRACSSSKIHSCQSGLP